MLLAVAGFAVPLGTGVAFAGDTGTAGDEPQPAPTEELLPIDNVLNQYLIDRRAASIIVVDQNGATQVFDLMGHPMSTLAATGPNSKATGHCNVAGVGSLPCHLSDQLPQWRKNNYHLRGQERGPAGCSCVP